MHSLLFFEFLGTSELLVVLVVALVIFGPRKLPELGRSLGSAMRQFRDASDSFKRTWETEALMANASAPALASAVDVPAEEPRPEPADERDPSTEARASLPAVSAEREDVAPL